MLRAHLHRMASLDAVLSFTASNDYRQKLLQISSQLKVANTRAICQVVEIDDSELLNLLREILYSDSQRTSLLRLNGPDAQQCVDTMQMVIPSHLVNLVVITN